MLGVAAVVAAEPPPGVQGEAHIAVRTAEPAAAGATVQRRRRTAPVEQQDRPSALVGESPEAVAQRARERVVGVAPQVHDLDRGKPAADPRAQRHPLEPVPALGSWRRRAGEQERSGRACPAQCHAARVVPRVVALLVGRVVLLVDDHEAEPPDRRKHGRARSDDDVGLAATDPCVRGGAHAVGQPRVQHRDAGPEARSDAPRRLGGERDLRHQHDGGEPPVERRGDRVQVDLGLPRPRHPVHEQSAPLARAEGHVDTRDRGRLLVGRQRRTIPDLGPRGDRPGLQPHLSVALHAPQERPRGADLVLQLGEPARTARQRREHGTTGRVQLRIVWKRLDPDLARRGDAGR